MESIKYAYSEFLETLSYCEFEEDKELFLAMIYIKKQYRNKGYGSIIMNEICNYADSKGMIITLTPLENECNQNLFSLVDFYHNKFGFVINENENRIDSIKDKMYRKPNRRKNYHVQRTKTS